MKALILAAGLGTRLAPFTHHIPKPLFRLNGFTLLDSHIQKLINAGCTGVIINAHHLARHIVDHIKGNHYPVEVCVKEEPSILGTGGAIKNVQFFLQKEPFMVVNSDIVTDIDLASVYQFHCAHCHPVTMVLHEYEKYHAVRVDRDNFIRGFFPSSEKNKTDVLFKSLAFTGIHVLDPLIFDRIPENEFSSIIDIYTSLLKSGEKIKAFVSRNSYWIDIGTPETYRRAVMDQLIPHSFEKAFQENGHTSYHEEKLQGDGSDRQWFRISSEKRSLMMSDHGISVTDLPELKSFIEISNHLAKKRIPVPRIYASEPFAGLVVMEDLGSLDLQTFSMNHLDSPKVMEMYQKVIDQIISFNKNGIEDFRAEWSYQSTHYDRQLILEKECRYFIEAFLKGYIGIRARYEDYGEEFQLLADNIEKFGIKGLIHRDAQSRNIMIKNNEPYFIDFQGARIGPIQYDAASLIIDPYVGLSEELQEVILSYYISVLSKKIQEVEEEQIRKGYEFCAVSRNLQMLGAFGFLSKVKKKPQFEAYIPLAAKRLFKNIERAGHHSFPKLMEISSDVYRRFK